MRSAASNRRRSTRNRSNREQPTPANQNQLINFVPKLKYSASSCNDDGIFLVSKRKRTPPTEAEIEAKRQKQSAIKKRKGKRDVVRTMKSHLISFVMKIMKMKRSNPRSFSFHLLDN